MDKQQISVKAVFDKVVEIESPEEREAYLDEACAEDGDLRRKVNGLLKAHEEAGSFLQSSPPGVEATIDSVISEAPGTIIGHYKLMEEIGEGGFGLVFVAEQQQPLRRKVALKIIKPGMDTKEVIARFEAERQALALMDHPNIARVLDAGATESGRPYFVMELVRGIPITDYCDQNKLTPRERLELFRTVCQAVQHAHQKGVIHRDVKPTNVLITLHDSKPVPKIIDFGVAKAINQQLTEKTIYTRHMQMVGTPLYMSPEQAELSGLDVDTRTDIYSLGVLLYELLTSTTPFDKERLREAAYDEVRRIIREEEPLKPSVRISTLGETATAISAHHKTDTKRLSQLVRGDLDWVVMKALEKDRTRRYETASGFARDIDRYLKDEPVEARAPSQLYRLRKYVRRNRVAVTTTALVAIALILGAGGIAWERTRGEFYRLVTEVQTCISDRDISRAEEIVEELQRREDGGRPETLSIQHALAMHYSEAEVDRLEDAVRLLQKTQETQRIVLGEDHADTRRTGDSLKDLAGRCQERAEALVSGGDPSQADQNRAIELVHLAFDLDTSSTWRWESKAKIQYYCGEWKESLQSFSKSLERESDSPDRRLLLAMLHHRLGEEDLATDWYAAAHDMATTWEPVFTRYDPRYWHKVQGLKEEAGSVLSSRELLACSDWTSEDYVSCYTRMIERYPKNVGLLGGRASHYGRLKNWNAAAADYAWAVTCMQTTSRPKDINQWPYTGWAVACLQIGDATGYQAACRSAFDHIQNHENPLQLGSLVVLCCLHPTSGIDHAELSRIAADALNRASQHLAYYDLVNGIVAYRRGRPKEALNLIPEGGFSNPVKDETLGLLFRALAHKKLGQLDQARALLEYARIRIEKDVPDPDGPSLGVRERSLLWGMFQTVLHEAEREIEPTVE